MDARSFQGIAGSTVSLSVTSTSSRVSLANSAKRQQLLVTNTGSGLCYFRITSSTGSAVVTDIPVLPGSAQTFSIPVSDSDTHIAAICDSGVTTTLKATLGSGL